MRIVENVHLLGDSLLTLGFYRYFLQHLSGNNGLFPEERELKPT